jgi:hypothetical protein
MVAANFDILDGCTWLVQLQLQLLHLSMDSVVHLLHINGNQPNKFLILYNLNTTKPWITFMYSKSENQQL